MTEPQQINKPQTVEQRLDEIAKTSNLTLRELKELVFQYQRAENKSCKEENEKDKGELDKRANIQKNAALELQQAKMMNEGMKIDIEFSELKIKHDLLEQGKYPPKKKKFLIF